MATGIMILGESGSGKSTSIENLNPKETFIVQSVNKPLPFKGFKNNYTLRTKDNPEGNRYVTDETSKIIKLLKSLNEDSKIKQIVLDDVQYTIINSFMKDIKEKKTGSAAFERYNDLAKSYWDLIMVLNELREDLLVFFLSHIEEDKEGKIGVRTIGKLLSEKIKIEGFFSIVLLCEVNNREYTFRTQTIDGNDPCKSPRGMFEELNIPNDLLIVKNKIYEYYEEV